MAGIVEWVTGGVEGITPPWAPHTQLPVQALPRLSAAHRPEGPPRIFPLPSFVKFTGM